MGWIPSWAAKSYAKLYVRYRDEPFDSATGQDLLGLNNHDFRRVIQELQGEGFLYRGRKATDRRKRIYHLVTPDQAVHALALMPKENVSLDNKLQVTQGHYMYMISGRSAAARYHQYVHSTITEIRVFRKDLGFWIAYLSEPKLQISVDGFVTEKGGVEVIILTDLTKSALAKAADLNGIKLESRENLIGSLLRQPTDDNVLNALALMLKAKNEFDWDRLAASDVRQEIGFLMDASNSRTTEQVFSEDLVNIFRGDYRLQKRFGLGTPDLSHNQDLAELAVQWGLELALHGRIIEKVINDLAP